MGDALIIKRGGGIADAFAAIWVMYPAGSICTCTHGGKVQTAKGTGGSYIFYLKEAGEYTLSCTDGTNTKSRNVVIQWQYEVQWIKLNYDFFIFKSGEGWKVPRGSFKDGTEYVVLNGGDSIDYTQLDLDLSRYSMITMQYIRRSAEGDNYGTFWGLGPDKTTGHAGGGNWTVRGHIRASESNILVTKSLTFDWLPSPAFFKIHQSYANNSAIYNVWFE